MTAPTIARLDAAGVTLVVAGPPGRIPGILYWGPALPEDEALDALAAGAAFGVPHGGLDVPFAPSLVPEAGWGYQGTPALDAFSLADDGTARRWATRFAVSAVEASDDALLVEAEDAVAALRIAVRLSLETGTGVLRAASTLTNAGDRPLIVDFLAVPALTVPRDDDRLVTWHGLWVNEFQRETQPWPRGARLLESRSGRTGHETFPGLLSLAPGTGESSGRVLGAHFGWSGNWRIVAEEVAPGHRQILAGVLHLPGECILAPGESLTTPTLYAAVSETGIATLSDAFHDEVRHRIVRPARPGTPRPVHFNSWEAVYFDHDLDTLKALATAAAGVGAERFVLDDGWFPARRNDRAGLGDWVVDRTVWPDGLHPLIDHVHAVGMGFGLWVEPEMVNPDSDLFRAHPDWALRLDGYDDLTGRHQLVLDLGREDVRDHLFGQLDAILREYRIEYLKWDMNRVLVMPGRAGRPVAAEQVPAVLDLMERLRAAHPGTEIESCSSGGGRIDYGILAATERFWLSDNNDTRDRWRMLREVSVFFPPELFGHHVGPAPCHTSGRVFPAAHRAYSAAALGGHMGFEVDLRTASEDERATLAAAVAFHKHWRGVLHHGRFRRLELEPPMTGQLILAADGTRFLAAVTQLETQRHAAGPRIRLAGLEPMAAYRIRFAAGGPDPVVFDRRYVSPLGTEDGLVLSGRALMSGGVRLPAGWPDRIVLIEGNRLEAAP